MDTPKRTTLDEVIEQHRKDPTFRALWDLQMRMDRIAEAHAKYVGAGGLTNGRCLECDLLHPCPTYIWATTERDPESPWDPEDDEYATNDTGAPA